MNKKIDFINISPLAQEHMRTSLKNTSGEYGFVRLRTESSGCAGISYKIQFAKTPELGDDILEFDGFKVLVDENSLVHLMGVEVDYEQNDLESGFVFNNPNQKGACNCGKSFYI